MLSIPHLIIVFIVALVVFGPEKLPELARNLGKIMGEFKRATGDLRSTFEGHLRDLEREADQRRLRSEVASAATPVSPAAAALPPEFESPVPPLPGSVATTPPHISGVAANVAANVTDNVAGASTEAEAPSPVTDSPEHAAATDNHSEENRIGGAPKEPAQPAPTLETEHNPETLTDAGIHPA
ncbi:MAG: twin-arginine translocase TatA/TatE family subunit [Candidatus Acidiferrales bacterium]|jgi:TatA/E family protein of Tat protein translocase